MIYKAACFWQRTWQRGADRRPLAAGCTHPSPRPSLRPSLPLLLAALPSAADYSDDACLNSWTLGQIARMQAMFLKRRPALVAAATGNGTAAVAGASPAPLAALVASQPPPQPSSKKPRPPPPPPFKLASRKGSVG